MKAGTGSTRTLLRRLLAVAAVGALLLTLGGAPAGAVGSDQRADGADRDVTVMSRNLYLGAELDPIFGATTVEELLNAVAVVWAQVLRTDFPTRAVALADEVAVSQPDLIGLQEVTLWRSRPLADPSAPEVVEYDFLEILLAELSSRGLHYAPVAEVTNFDGEQPNVATGRFIRITDRDVILARTDLRAGDLKLSNPQGENFVNKLVLDLLGTPLEVPRGWTSVDVKVRGQRFRFVNTHLEAFDLPGEPLRRAQVAELLAGPLATPLPAVLVGDINSRAPDGPAYRMLVDAGLADAWSALRPGEPGLTCCFDPDLADPTAPLTSRIDVVLADPALRPVAVDVVGDEPADRIAGLWPSDHAGVVATLVLEPPGRR